MSELFGKAKRDSEAFTADERRAVEYPSLEETLDALIAVALGGPKADLQAIKAARDAAKAKHPKA